MKSPFFPAAIAFADAVCCCGCGTSAGAVRTVDKPLNYKEFVIQNAELENAGFTLTDITVTGLNIHSKVRAFGTDCFVPAVNAFSSSNRKRRIAIWTY